MAIADLVAELTRGHVGYELVPHRHTERARDEAAALGMSQEDVGKTVILTTSSGFVRAVVPASERLDLQKTRAHLGGGGEIQLATERELVGAYPAFELGAVPPFGGPSGDRVLVDRRVAGREWVTVEAGTHDESVKLKTTDLLDLTKAVVADICVD